MANKDINILLAEDEHNNPCDFNKLMSTMEHNYLADTSSVNLEPRGPVSVANPDYINNLDEPNNYKTETLIYPNNCTVLTESVGLGDNDGKYSNKSDEVKRSSTRKSTRKITSSNQKSEKTGTKLPARKSRRNSGKMLMLDLLAADVRRQQRSEMARKARPSSWGLGGIIDEIFKKNSEMSADSYENTKSRKSKAGHKRGDRNTDSVNLSIQGENRSLNNGLLLKLKLGTKPILNCQINTIPDMDKDLESFRDVDIETSILQSDVNNNHVKKEVSRVSNDNLVSSKSFLFDTFVAEKEKSQDLTSKIHEITELLEPVENRCSDPGTSPDSEVINVIPDAQISGNTAEEIKISSKDCLSNQLVDCDVLSCEKEIERSWSTGAFMSITNPVSSRNISSREECQLGTLQETEVMVSLDMSTIDSIMKADVSIAEIESVESKSNGQHLQIIPSLKSSENKKTTDCKQNLLQDKSTPMRKVNEKSDTESHPVTGNLEEGSRSTVEPLSNSTMVPSAWVCCDDCHKWRRISAILADSIELTGCRWICKENMDKTFADCSIPQEMSNADINQELELSEASGEEDAPNNHVNSNQLVQKQPTDSYPLQLSWKLIKTNMFLHRNRRSQPMDEVMVCHCKPPLDGRMGCRDECLNRMLNIECVKGTCPCGESCSNQKFQKRKYSKIKCVPSGKKGFGLQLQEDIPRGRFLIEYVGEVLDMPAYEARQKEYASKGHKHFYFMTLNGSEVIDACAKGNLGRFINHSCEPNCRTEKWMVNGEVCIGLFAIRDIKKGEELTFDYNYVRVFGAAAKKCVCGSSRCRGVIGGDPLSDETVVLGDSDDEYPEPVTFYENPSNKFENIISGTPQISEITSKNNSSEFLVAADFENVENSQSQSPDSLLVTDEKNDDSVERELSEIKLENSETLDTCFKVYNNVKSEIIPKNVKDLKKKLKSQTNSKKCTILKPKSRSKLPSSSPLKKWKSKNMQPEMDKKPLIEPQKPKKIVVDNLTGFDAVEEALNSLLNENKGISKRRDASKGYLTLLCLTAYGGNGKGIQSNRDLSMILGALLLTKSRTVLLDIINKNGLQMLHILLKRYKKDFDKTPILRKILKVFEYLAETKILTVETILKPSPHRGESLKESILSLTEHANQQVHQIARSFRDRWIPWSARRVNWAERETERTEYQQNSNFKSYPSQPTNSSDREIKSSEFTDINDTKIVQDSSASCTTDRIRTRKRKSRWDEPGDINSINSINFTNSIPDLQPPLQNQTKNEDMDMDAPPGFSSTTTNRHKTVMGQPQDRYNSRLPTAFGVPLSVLKKLDTKPESNVSESWVVAPGIKFYPFPPLPVYPRERVPGPFDHNQPGFQYRSPNPNTVDRRYFKQQKWNNNHNSSRSGHPWNPNKYRPACFNGPKQHYEGDGNGFYQQSHE